MAESTEPGLVALVDSELSLAEPRDDVRGRTVVDRNGNDVGDVDGLMVDEAERRVRFLQVGSGGFLGIGEKKRLIPVDAVRKVDEKVHIDVNREQVSQSPEYDPDLVEGPAYGDFYDYYGHTPFWVPGYVPPGGFPGGPRT